MADGIRLAVTGGRHYADVPRLFQMLDGILDQTKVALLIEGASDDVTGPYKGADYWSRQWAKARGIQTQSFSADWEAHGRSAGPRRNAVMVLARPDLVVAFPGGKGTNDMIRQAEAAGIEIRRMW